MLDFEDKGKMKFCFKAFVKDAESLNEAIEKGMKFDYLSILFDDPTNIPLELVIARLQPTNTILMKEIKDINDVEDAIVSLGVMEVGADGIIFSPTSHEVYDSFIKELDELIAAHVCIQVGTITRSKPIGMGYRGCIDLAAIFNPDEGILVGSTSQGGLLCCPEVFHLPYMELRPFRVNAGGIHSYVFHVDHTDYLSELKAGSSVMVVNAAGKVKKYPVGRIKTEIRPLRLIEAAFEGGEIVNVILQDDWHVRIYSDKVTPLNITELKPGDKVLGYVTEPGRHVGIKVDEHIIEK
ncbi:3-dehydroquinate synthase II [Nibrella saemangeumensis]|uniref:3-dehydroquinate synthase II n=1 Tax=Nibrella saemangeumensis TaxID=1084526 RepID=A0ABP8NB36_9BACT